MYAESVIQSNIEAIEAKTGLTLVRHDHARSEEFTEIVQPLWFAEGQPLRRPLTKEESAFVVNEQIMCQLDFRYWSERYCKIAYDGVVGGGIGNLKLGASQLILLDLIGKIQAEQVDRQNRGETVDGIMIAAHKARQVWYTALSRGLQMHRATLIQHSRCIGVSVDDQKIQEVYERDLLAYDNLPWFLKPQLVYQEKNAHLSFSTKSKIGYMIDAKKGSLGQGSQFDFGHCTELSEYANPGALEIDFFPTFPQNVNTLLILESRANGRGNWWHQFTESVRKGEKERWRYCFTPYYAEPRKYRKTPPPDWQPSEIGLMHAKKVWETSQEFVGKQVMLPKEQLCWWEAMREEYRKSGSLNFFLSNYCATPEESFQHNERSAFDPELLDELRNRAKQPLFYDFERERDAA